MKNWKTKIQRELKTYGFGALGFFGGLTFGWVAQAADLTANEAARQWVKPGAALAEMDVSHSLFSQSTDGSWDSQVYADLPEGVEWVAAVYGDASGESFYLEAENGDTASMVLDLGTGDVSVTVNGELLFEVTDAAKFDGWSERHYENMLAYTLMFSVIESPALAQAPGEPCPDLVLIGNCITCAACAASPAAATPTCVSACSICSLCLIRQGFPQAVYKWLDSAAQIMQETNELHRRMGLIPPYSVGHCKL